MKFSESLLSTCCKVSAIAFLTFALSPLAQAAGPSTAVKAQDVNEQWRSFPPTGRLTIVMYTNADLEQESKALSKALDQFRGQSDFMFIQVVDLRGDIAPIARRMVEKQIRKELDLEAARVKPFYAKYHSNKDPRADLSTIADYGGTVLDSLGWSDRVDTVRFIVYNSQGVALRRIDNTSDPKVAISYFHSLFGTHTANVTQ